MKSKPVKKNMPKAQVGKAVQKAGAAISKGEAAVKKTTKSAVNKTATAAKKADDWMEKNLKLLTKTPEYRASKYVLKKMLK